MLEPGGGWVSGEGRRRKWREGGPAHTHKARDITGRTKSVDVFSFISLFILFISILIFASVTCICPEMKTVLPPKDVVKKGLLFSMKNEN